MRLGFCGWVVGFGLLAVLAGCPDEQPPTCAPKTSQTWPATSTGTVTGTGPTSISSILTSPAPSGDLGETDIDPALFDLRIEALDDTTDPTRATPDLPWIRLFGLDQRDTRGQLVPDGLPDLAEPWLFDLHKGLIRFPREDPHPFAADPLLYQTYALPVVYPWEGSYLATHLAPEIYAMATNPADFPLHRHFAIRGSIFRCPLP